MKVIICDTCGKQAPGTQDAEIHPLILKYGGPTAGHIEVDICLVCLEKLRRFFHPEQTLNPEVAPEANIIAPEIKQFPGHRNPPPPPPIPNPVKIEKQKDDKLTAILCAHCKKPFTPKTKRAVTCSKYCGQHKWIDEQKMKKEKEPKKEKPPKPPKVKPQAKESKPKTMPAKKDQPKESNHINNTQDIIGEILNPEIDKKRKKAIAQSPKIRTEDLIQVPGMPRTWVQFKPGSDASSLENFQQRVGKANSGGVQSSKKTTEPIFEEI